MVIKLLRRKNRKRNENKLKIKDKRDKEEKNIIDLRQIEKLKRNKIEK
jgi:hypothetical protein